MVRSKYGIPKEPRRVDLGRDGEALPSTRAGSNTCRRAARGTPSSVYSPRRFHNAKKNSPSLVGESLEQVLQGYAVRESLEATTPEYILQGYAVVHNLDLEEASGWIAMNKLVRW